MRITGLVALLLMGCADHARLPDACDSPYSATVMECARAPRGPPKDLIEVCDPRWRPPRCEMVERDEVERVLRDLRPGIRFPSQR